MTYRVRDKHRKRLEATNDPLLAAISDGCKTEADFLDAVVGALCEATEDRQRLALGLLKVGANIIGITNAINEAVPPAALRHTARAA